MMRYCYRLAAAGALLLLISLPGLSQSPSPVGTTASQQAVLADVARGGAGTGWTSLDAAQSASLETKARKYLDNYKAHHIPDGLNADIQWSDFNRTRVRGYDGLGDSAAWTGHYLAAQALRYAVTGEPAILDEINAVLDTFEMLTRVTGRDGFIARHAIPYSTLVAKGSPYLGYYAYYGHGKSDDRPNLGKRAFHGVGKYKDYVWLGRSSRDTYDGVNFGLATTYKYVKDPAIRARIAAMVERINDRWMADKGIIKDGKKNTQDETANPPWAAAMLRLAATVNPKKYQAVYRRWAGLVSKRLPMDEFRYHNVFVGNLNYIRMYVLNILETDPKLKAKWRARIDDLWRQTADHVNAQYAAIYMAATGNTSDMRAVATLQGTLADFPDLPRFVHRIINSTRKDLEFITAAEDGRLYAKYALPIAERPTDDFIWQRCPLKLDERSNRPLEYPGIDVFLPYWIGRQIGVIKPAGQ